MLTSVWTIDHKKIPVACILPYVEPQVINGKQV
jgi:hypothetical protein